MNKIYLFLIILISISCNHKTDFIYQYELQYINEFDVPLIDTSKNVIYDVQFFKTDTAKLLFVYTNCDYIYVYNIDNSKLIKQIPLLKNKWLFSFNVVGFDSIFLLYQAGFFNEMNDSVLQMIDYNGKIKKIYKIKDKHFITSSNLIYDTNFYYIHTVFEKMIFHDNKLYFLVSKFNQYELGDSLSRSAELPPVGYFNTETDSLYYINFPFIFPPDGYFYPQAFNEYKINLSASGNLLFHTKYSNEIVEYDATKNNFISHFFNSVLLDTIEPQKDKQKCGQLYFIDNVGYYSRMYYDNNSELYFKTLFLPNKITNDFGFVVLDKNFNKLGEGIVSDDYSYKMIFDDGNIILLNKSKTFENEGRLYFTKFKISRKKIKIKEFKQYLDSALIELGNCTTNNNKNSLQVSILPFLKNYFNKNTYAVLIIPYMYSCPSCKNYATLLYSANKDLYQNNDVFLMYDNQNKVALKSYLKSYGLSLKSDKIFIDTMGTYNKYLVENFYNPRLVIVQDNNVFFDKTYKPDDLELIAIDILNYIENKNK